MALQWANALAGGAGGAAGGALSGSAVPGIGTAIGAGIGGIGGFLSGLLSGSSKEGESWWEWLTGTPEGQKQWSQFSPEDQQALTELRQNAFQQLKNPYEGFEPIRQNALNTFFQDIVPGLQETFNSRGDNNYGSGVLQTNLSSAGGRLSDMLAAQQSQYGQQNRQNALQQLSMAIQPQENMYQQGGPGFAQQFATPENFEKLFKLIGNYRQGQAGGDAGQQSNPIGGPRFSSSSFGVNQALDSTKAGQLFPQQAAPAYGSFGPMNQTLNRIQGMR